MTRHNLPILVPGRTTPVHVPCALPESFSVSAFLPSRGLREFTCWLTTRDPLTAEIKDVVLNNHEGDPRGPNGYELDEDEQKRADEAAVDVLEAMLAGLGIHASLRGPVKEEPLRSAIALAFHAERHAVDMGIALHTAYVARDRDHAGDILKRVPDLGTERGQDASAACEAMRCFVSDALDAACAAQSEKAEAQRDAHASGDEDDAGSERIRAPRSLDVPTLKCLSLDVEF